MINRVICINPRTGKTRSFPTATVAAKALKLDPVTISHACAGTHSVGLYGGFQWGYAAGLEDVEVRWRQPIAAYKDGQLVAEYESVQQAAKQVRPQTRVHVASSHISCVARGDGKTAYGFTWKTQGPAIHYFRPQIRKFNGRKHTAETKAKMSDAKAAKKVAVASYDDQWRLVAMYPSITAAGLFHRPGGMSPRGKPLNPCGQIIKVLKGKEQHAYGLRWKVVQPAQVPTKRSER